MSPLHKRPFAFWLPAFGLLFLLWAWANSMHHGSAIEREMLMTSRSGLYSAEPRESASNFEGAIIFTTLEVISPENYTITRGPIELQRTPHPGREWFPTTLRRSIPAQDTVIFHELILPHWLLILAYLALWSIASAWRRHRLKHRPPPP
jgi:hypothetical protein